MQCHTDSVYSGATPLHVESLVVVFILSYLQLGQFSVLARKHFNTNHWVERHFCLLAMYWRLTLAPHKDKICFCIKNPDPYCMFGLDMENRPDSPSRLQWQQKEREKKSNHSFSPWVSGTAGQWSLRERKKTSPVTSPIIAARWGVSGCV